MVWNNYHIVIGLGIEFADLQSPAMREARSVLGCVRRKQESGSAVCPT
jgi:hypothetical protein